MLWTILYKNNGPILCPLNKNSSVRKTKRNRLMLVSIYAVCSKRKSRFVKNQEESGISINNPNYDGYQRGLGSMVHKLFNKKTGSWAIATSKTRVNVNEMQFKNYINH